MMDFKYLRNKMVDDQIIARGITDTRVIDAMRKVPRHYFVPESEISHAYEDGPIGIGEGQTISQPYMVALMSQYLQLSKYDNVYEVGTGSGYQTAILAELCEEVVSIETVEKLASQAREVLAKLNYVNITVKIGDGSKGLENDYSFNAMLVTAAAPNRLDHLFRSLSDKGRALIPIGSRESQILMYFHKRNNQISEKKICGCVFVPLKGRHGWN